MAEMWDLILSPPADAPTNMAVDEALLQTVGLRARPVLRIYAWTKPAVSFGYAQRFPARLAERYELVRRPTGGGIVYHGSDTTYSVVTPPSHPLYAMTPREAYGVLHEAVAKALKAGAVADRVTSHADEGSATNRWTYECFTNPVAGDVMAEGRKLAGGAQRRTRRGLLHQGSIAARLTADQLTGAFRNTLNVNFQTHALTAAECALVEQLAKEKYASAEWNHRLSA